MKTAETYLCNNIDRIPVIEVHVEIFSLHANIVPQLWIDAPSRFIEYLENLAATERAINADGMFRLQFLHQRAFGFR